MLGIQTKYSDHKIEGSYRRLNSSEGRTYVREESRYCCCCKTRKRSRNAEMRRLVWMEKCISLRLTSLTMSLLMLGGALYLNCLITASPDIIMDDPNSPDTEVLLIQVEEFTVRQKYIDLKIPVDTTIAAAGYLKRTVYYDFCEDYDDICKTLRTDGNIYFFTCILGLVLTLPPLLLASRCRGKSAIQCLSFLPAIVMCIALVVWWLDAYLKLSNLKIASLPLHSTYANETTMIDMNFEDKRMFPGYSLCLVSLTGLALCLNFVLIMCA